jgi:hypothetical protein
VEAVEQFKAYITAETLTVEMVNAAVPEGFAQAADSFDGEDVTVGLIKA